LKDPSAASYVLTMDDKDETFETFEWGVPDFGFQASATYTLQADVAGNNFANASDITTSRFPTVAVKVGAINDILLGLGLTPQESADIELRVISDIGNGVPAVVSTTKTIEVTPYATTFPPIWGMGAALKGWGPWPDNAVEWQSSEFRKYETVTYLTNGGAFRFFAQLDWNPQSWNYPFFTSVDPVFENANDDDSNLKVVGESGWYKINVDLTAKTVTAVAVDEPVMYMVGGAINGWNWDPGTPVKMTYIKPGVFEATTNISNDIFRFFGQYDWAPVSYKYTDFETVDPAFELNPNDNDNNFKYVGTPGSQKVRVDLNAKSVTLGDPPAPVLYITGSDFGWGWTDGLYEEMTYNAGAGTFTITTDLTNDGLFRFFPQQDWNPSYTYEYFTTIDSELGDQGPTDHNFRYNGATGPRTITVNLTTKVVTVD
ncbi:MAG TPA: SusE domain-containing protein, partial [Ohtaekwangia sp.]|nr:SusE domain-containing protein [Ohtaekwangia sp.]